MEREMEIVWYMVYICSREVYSVVDMYIVK